MNDIDYLELVGILAEFLRNPPPKITQVDFRWAGGRWSYLASGENRSIQGNGLDSLYDAMVSFAKDFEDLDNE